MPPSPLTRRVQILEEKVERLERLPSRIDAIELQILQFREEVRVEFSATREGLRDSLDSLRSELQQLHGQAVARITLTEQALLYEMSQLDERAASRDADTRRFMRMMYEDLIDRIATLGESGRRPD